MKANNDLIEKYTYRVEWSEEDHAHIAHCLEFPSLMAHGNTIGKALSEIEVAVATSIEWMKEDGEVIPEPFGTKKYKGNISLRVPADLHRSIAIRAAEEGVSINQYVLSRISFA
ncbi:MAG: type II toxin-antitoxin system HicB family antitoxin [Clostridiales Family XIII bacterium]|jgi:predicted RNase H-like HicB family nuclease|nr:type II toxin-antitoxin system HicB family antitoxin [Clostridiales Family XIII bacterium]